MRDMREERGKEIADKGNVKKVNDNSFKVKSQSGKGVYEVKATPNGIEMYENGINPDFLNIKSNIGDKQ